MEETKRWQSIETMIVALSEIAKEIEELEKQKNASLPIRKTIPNTQSEGLY